MPLAEAPAVRKVSPPSALSSAPTCVTLSFGHLSSEPSAPTRPSQWSFSLTSQFFLSAINKVCLVPDL